MPFTDAWFLENDLRMLHATLVWQLHKRIARENCSEARVMLQVYTVYLCMVNQPQLNLTRAAVALSLVAMALWQERECRHCDHTLLAPADEKHDVACPGCRLYHRYRCFRCGSTFDAQPMGRPRTVCHHCNDSKSSGTTGSTSSHP
jgi:DNA-directed RNA polymerase subunit RPC12/RpoP